MTEPAPRKISVYLPADVVAQLDEVENASAYIAESLRMRRRREAVRGLLRDAGYEVTDTGVERMRRKVAVLDARRGKVA